MTTTLLAVHVRMKDPVFSDASGSLFYFAEGGESTVPHLGRDKSCQHVETTCNTCLSRWTDDHEILGYVVRDDAGHPLELPPAEYAIWRKGPKG